MDADGIIGLGLPSEEKSNNFLNELYNQGAIERKMFSFYSQNGKNKI